MSHPAASIKSIYSGKLNIDTPDMLDLEYEDTASVSSEDLTSNLSRNSTTSCLSTTATKDGIEGRKIHRKGHGMMSHLLNRMEDAEKYNMMLEKQDRVRLSTPDGVRDSPEPLHSDTAPETNTMVSPMVAEVVLSPAILLASLEPSSPVNSGAEPVQT